MPCVLVIEACGGVHFQGDIRKLARDVYFVPSACVKAFVNRKNINVAGAEVICEVSYHLKAVMTEVDDTFSVRDERAETGPRNTLLGPCSANPLTYATRSTLCIDIARHTIESRCKVHPTPTS